MQYRKLSELKKLKNNPRIIRDKQFKTLCDSIRDNPVYFEARPIILSNRTGELVIIAGNQRYEAAKFLKMKEVPTFLIENLTEEKEKEITIRDNISNGEFDFDILANEWSDLPLVDWGVDLPGGWLKSNTESTEDDFDADAAIAQNTEPPTRLGDIWLLGRHRVMCGDSTKKEDVGRLMAGKRADMVFTDPPYGVSYSDKNVFLNSIDKGNRIQTPIKNDHLSIDNLSEEIIYPAFCNIRDILASRSSYYITAPQGGDLLMMMMMMMKKSGLILRHMLVWVKNNHVLGRTDYNYKHEPILYGWIDVHDFYGKGDFKFSTWEIPKPLKSDLHPTMKPVALIANAMKNSTKEGQLVADLFLGSGTTLIAAEQLNRICYGMEIDPVYVMVILERWMKLTGKQPILEATGKTFNEGGIQSRECLI